MLFLGINKRDIEDKKSNIILKEYVIIFDKLQEGLNMIENQKKRN